MGALVSAELKAILLCIQYNSCVHAKSLQSCSILCDPMDYSLSGSSVHGILQAFLSSWEIDGETVETVSDFIFGAPKSLQMVTAPMKLKDAYSLEGKL